MKQSVCKTPFATRLSGSKKEAGMRISGIINWKKMRPSIIVLTIMALVVLLCGALVSCDFYQEQPQLSEEAMKNRRLLSDPQQLAKEIMGMTCEEVCEFFGIPDSEVPGESVSFDDENGVQITIHYTSNGVVQGVQKGNEWSILFGETDLRANQIMKLLDDIELLAKEIKGMTYAQVKELLGEADVGETDLYSCGYKNSMGEIVTIGFDGENGTATYVADKRESVSLLDTEVWNGGTITFTDGELSITPPKEWAGKIGYIRQNNSLTFVHLATREVAGYEQQGVLFWINRAEVFYPADYMYPQPGWSLAATEDYTFYLCSASDVQFPQIDEIAEEYKQLSHMEQVQIDFSDRLLEKCIYSINDKVENGL